MFDRRKFLTGLLALPGLALAKIVNVEPENSMQTIPGLGTWNGLLDKFMAGEENRFGLWRVRWTGWKDSCQTLDVVGQWAAFPINRDGSADSTRLAVLVSTPGSWGPYRHGDTVNISPRWPQKLNSDYFHLGRYEEILKALEPERRIALEALLELVRVAPWTDKGPFEYFNPEPLMVKLTAKSQFYLDAEWYMKTYFPGVWDHRIGQSARDDLYKKRMAYLSKTLLG